MALFPRSPADAVNAAIAMIDSLRGHSGREVTVGIGIHTGNVMLGTVGSADRMDTTVIGDTVNLAARLEELTKEMPWNIIISDDVLRTLPSDMTSTTDLGTVLIRGRSTPLIIHGIAAR
jgi:class 3 adenylate cyclase